MSDPFMDKWEQYQAEKVENAEPEQHWSPQMPDSVWEAAKYYHKCPMCGGYLERRGDFFTCQKCPMEIPEGGEQRTASVPVFVMNSSSFLHYSVDEMQSYLDEQSSIGAPMYVALRQPATLELRGGKIPIPGAVPFDVSSEGVPLYKYLELGWNPETNMRETSHPENIQGAPEQRGVHSEFPKNRRGEVRDFDHSLGWAYVHVPLHYRGVSDARLHPHSGAGWVPYSDLRPIQPRKSPFRGR